MNYTLPTLNKKERQSNIELLRIFAVVGVIFTHFCSFSINALSVTT